MAHITKVIANIPKADVVRTCSCFRSRIKKVVVVNSDFFNKSIFHIIVRILTNFHEYILKIVESTVFLI